MTEFLSPLLAQEGNAGSALNLLLFPLLIGGLFLVLFRPQRKRQKELQKLREEIGIGDEVMTSSGIYGFITGEEDDLYWLEIDQDVQIRISKAAIHSRVPDDAENSDSETKSASQTRSTSGAKTASAEKELVTKSAAKTAAAKDASKIKSKNGSKSAKSKSTKSLTADSVSADDSPESDSIDSEAET